MKIDRNKLKKGNFEVPQECKVLIDRFNNCTNDEEFLTELQQIKSWVYGKCELMNWCDVLDRMDIILERCSREIESWTLASNPCPSDGTQPDKPLLLAVLQFSSLLIEHSFTRHIYSSMDYLTALLASSDMTIVLAVMDVLYVFSKRSNFITRLSAEKKQNLINRLLCLAESWGGKENGFGLAVCCQNLPINKYPASATTLHFEYYEETDELHNKKGNSQTLRQIRFYNMDKSDQDISSQMKDFVSNYKISKDKEMKLYTRIRLAKCFSDYKTRLLCVQARLQAISTLVYSNTAQEHLSLILYSGFIEELVDTVELEDENITDIKAASLRTLTAVVHLERNPKYVLSNIIEATGASMYHGFLPTLMRNCILHLTDPNLNQYPHLLATALFSFLYHLASYENGGEALVSCGILESLLLVINWRGDGNQEHITFVTRAVRVVDLITTIDMQSFQTHGAMSSFINRLQYEIDICRKEQPFTLRPRDSNIDNQIGSPGPSNSGSSQNIDISDDMENSYYPPADYDHTKNQFQCFPQRAALLKSILNFLKKTITDQSFSDSIRHMMDGSLPRSLKHIISNAEYYGPSLFLLATELVTVYVFQEPSMLSTLQNIGLTDVIMQALLVKKVPATKEALSSLPHVFSALCLNARGLEAFVACCPFESLFMVLLSADYLPAMRRRRSSDLPGETATSLGSAMDELMRHQPSLRSDAIKAIIKLIGDVARLGEDPSYVCQQIPAGRFERNGTLNGSTSRSNSSANFQNANSSNSSDDDDDDEDANLDLPPQPKLILPSEESNNQVKDKTPIPLMDYVLNVMKFVEAILSNNTTDDHCREFVTQDGLKALMKLLSLPNLPLDYPTSPACLAVASLLKSILSLTVDVQVLQHTFTHLGALIKPLNVLGTFQESCCSALLDELVKAAPISHPETSITATPLLHALSHVHACLVVLMQICKSTQNEMKTLTLNYWAANIGLQVLGDLQTLYMSLIIEESLLRLICSENGLPAEFDMASEFLNKEIPKAPEENAQGSSKPTGHDGVSLAMESLSTTDVGIGSPMDTIGDDSSSSSNKQLVSQTRLKRLEVHLTTLQRLIAALSDLFLLLAKLCILTPPRQRRTGLQALPTGPTPTTKAITLYLSNLLKKSLQWQNSCNFPTNKLRIINMINAVKLATLLLLDEKKQPYHLLLHNFVISGGQDLFFNAFKFILVQDSEYSLEKAVENIEYSDCACEFLEVWLNLVEKLSNSKNIMDSPYSGVVKKTPGSDTFNPLTYIINMQKMTFESVMYLWNKKPLKPWSQKICELIVNILCNVIAMEIVIKEKITAKDKENVDSISGSTLSTPVEDAAAAANIRIEPPVNSVNLQQLIDMGFSREHASEALRRTTNLEQATEYCLLNPPIHEIGVYVPEEEEQMARALVMSLGSDIIPISEETGASTSNGVEFKAADAIKSDEPMDQQMLDDFSATTMNGCKNLLDTLPMSVYWVSDLICALTKRNGKPWLNNTLSILIEEISSLSLNLMEKALPMRKNDQRTVLSWVNELSSSTEALQLSIRLHLLILLFEALRMSCFQTIEKSEIICILIKLLHSTQQCLAAAPEANTPKWLVSLLLFLDLYEKISVISKRKMQLQNILGENHVWKWFDDRVGRWANYGVSNNKTIDDAYRDGQTTARFAAGRRRYLIQFNAMIQINEETRNRRPIMLSLPTSADREAITDKTSPPPNQEVLTGLSHENCLSLIRSCVGLMTFNIDSDTLHAVLRLILRLTRNFELCEVFVEVQGPQLLLSLKGSSNFQGFSSLATLIIKHIMEDMASLRYLMEKIIRSSTVGTGSSSCGVATGSNGSKEMNYVLRVLAPVACRQPELFVDIAKSTLHINLANRKEEDEARLTSTVTPQLLNCNPTSILKMPKMEALAQSVLSCLLRALVSKNKKSESKERETKDVDHKKDLSFEDKILKKAERETLEEAKRQGHKLEPGELLISKSTILRLLAELIRSYSGCASYITLYSFAPGENEYNQEACTVLSFVIDHLLIENNNDSDIHISGLARVFLASIAAANHSPESQINLVLEIKSALQRTLVLPESADKHSKVQALAGLISTVIEACPATGSHIPNQVFKNQQNILNNMVRLFYKRGLISDLARVPHSLDLSSPHTSTTVNAILKPLETLSRIVNQPQTFLSRVSKQTNSTNNEPILSLTEFLQSTDGRNIHDNENQEGQEMSEQIMRSHVEADMMEDVITQAERHDQIIDENAEPGGGSVGDEDDDEDIDDRSNGRSIQNETILMRNSTSSVDIGDEIPDGHNQRGDNIVEIDIAVSHDNQNDLMISHDEISESSNDDNEGDNDVDDDDDGDDVGDAHVGESDGDAEHEENEDVEHEEEELDDTFEHDDDDEDEDEDVEDEDDEDEENDEATFRELDNVNFNIWEDAEPSVAPNNLFLETGTGARSYQVPVLNNRNADAVIEATDPIVPPAPRGVMANHPLFLRYPETNSITTASSQASISRLTRTTGRPRGTYRYNPNTQTLHVHYSRFTNPPALLQRLLGNTAADMIELTNSLELGNTLGNTDSSRLHVMSGDEFRVIMRGEETLLGSFFQNDIFTEDDQSNFGFLSVIPSALSRWTEEARVLDGEIGMHECVLCIKTEIIEHLEKIRDAEINELILAKKKATEEKQLLDDKKIADVLFLADKKINVAGSSAQEVEMKEHVEEKMEISVENKAHYSNEHNIPEKLPNANVVDNIGSSVDADDAPSTIQSIPSVQMPSNIQRIESETINLDNTNLGESNVNDSNQQSITQQISSSNILKETDLTAQNTDAQTISETTQFSDNIRADGIISSIANDDERLTAIGSNLANEAILIEAAYDAMHGPIVVDVHENNGQVLAPQYETRNPQAINMAMHRDISENRVISNNASATVNEYINELHVSQRLLPPQRIIDVNNSVNRQIENTNNDNIAGIFNAYIDNLTESVNAAIMSVEAPAQNTAASTSGGETEILSSNMFGDIPLPEGVDPSFLAALPDNIRQEVIMEQLRLQRIQQRAQEQQQEAQSFGMSEVSPEFLAALPPSIQEEVLTQQRAEQSRLAAESSRENPEAPTDPALFIHSLPTALRMQVLADMDDSMLALLPPDLATEASQLRREAEIRHQLLLQDRIFNQGPGVLSGILRHSALTRNNPLSHNAITLRPLLGRGLNWYRGRRTTVGAMNPITAHGTNKSRGKHLLDPEALSCMVILLFMDTPKLNVLRLHRVLRNVSYYAPTRNWIVRTLLSVLTKISLENTQDEAEDHSFCDDQPSWLNIYLQAALGSQTHVFRMRRISKKSHISKPGGTVIMTIHPQAAAIICRHIMDALISLAKSFPNQFLPLMSDQFGITTIVDEEDDGKGKASPGKIPGISEGIAARQPDFWEILVKLDGMVGGRKGKSIQKTNNGISCESNNQTLEKLSDSATIGQLLTLLSHPVIRRSQLLTDRLLRLLRLVTAGLTSTGNVATPPTTQNTTNLSNAPASATANIQENKSENLPQPKEETGENIFLEKPLLVESQLKMPVDVLISKWCSEEGLEDATSLLLQLSKMDEGMRVSILKLLMQGAHQLGMVVCQHIRLLLIELDELFASGLLGKEEDDSSSSSQGFTQKGILLDRFSGGNVVVQGSSKVKNRAGRELQLASMQQLTSKNSSQNFLLRILKVVIQLRDSSKLNKPSEQIKQDPRIARQPLINATNSGQSENSISVPNLSENSQSNSVQPESGNSVSAQNLSLSDLSNSPARYEINSLNSDNSNLIASNTGRSDPEIFNPDMNTEQPSVSIEDTIIGSSHLENTIIQDSVSASIPMDVENGEAASLNESRLSEQLDLDELWSALGECLIQLGKLPDNHAVLLLQPAVEAFFLVHAGVKKPKETMTNAQRREDQLSHVQAYSGAGPTSPAQNTSDQILSEAPTKSTSVELNAETQKFIHFAETHRTVLNQILRQSPAPLASGPFAVLVDYTRVLDFDVKRRYFRHELEQMDDSSRHEDVAVHIKRESVFEDSFRELHRRTSESWKHRFYIVFEGEEGQDAGGLLREWYIIISREIFNPNYALFCASPGDRVTYTINPASHCNSNHLSYFKFVGRIIAKAIYDNKLLECYFTRSFYKHILGVPVKYTDMECEDYAFYQGLVYLLENNIADLGYDIMFSTEIREFGVTAIRDLKQNGRNIRVTEESKKEYVKLVCQMKMTGAIKQQLTAFLEGFYSIIPKRFISIFNEQELELLISGLPTIDIDDLKNNTEYHKYQATSLQIQWFWRALRAFDQADRARFLQFVTGTSKVPLQGFAFLEGMNGTQKFQIHRDDRSTDRLPSAHTCFNQLDLPVYETYDKLKQMLLLAINECSEGFGLA